MTVTIALAVLIVWPGLLFLTAALIGWDRHGPQVVRRTPVSPSRVTVAAIQRRLAQEERAWSRGLGTVR